MQRAWKGATDWFVPHDCLSLVLERTRDYQPSDGITHNGPRPPPYRGGSQPVGLDSPPPGVAYLITVRNSSKILVMK